MFLFDGDFWTSEAALGSAERIKNLREHALNTAQSLESGWDHWRWRLVAADLWKRTEGEAPAIRRARIVAGRLDSMQTVIAPGELLLGHPVFEPMPLEQEATVEQAQRVLDRMPPHPGGDTGHFTPDYETIFCLGLEGIREEIRARKASAGETEGEFYAACDIALSALMDFVGGHVELAAQCAEQASDRGRREELSEVARVCRHVAEKPPRTFHEAIQLLHFVMIGVWFGEQHGLTTPGRLDRLLGPFYEADIAAGRLAPARAQELIDCLYVLMNEYCPPGLAISVMVGGRDASGRDRTNAVSMMCVQALLNTRLNYPTVGVCWHERTPDRLLDISMKALAEGRGSPAFFNDELIAAGLRDLGVSVEDSYSYQNSTCVEIAPIGTSNVWVAQPYFNVTRPLLDELEAVASSVCSAPGKFDEFKERVKERLAETVAEGAQKDSAAWEGRERWLGYPLLSCFVRDCLEKGLDIDRGGARYNWVENSFVGTANLVDSLVAVRELVYRREQLSLSDLWEVLATDFRGHEDLRLEILHRLPKYGNDDDEADDLAVEITRFYEETCRRHLIAGKHRFVPGMFCWVKHVSFGQETGATPDGRASAFALADGAGPAQGRERCGPTAAVKSVTKWNHQPVLGGVVLNMKFSPSVLHREDDRTKLKALLETYMRLGGFEVQINVVDRRTLIKAQKHPEAYRDLLVRVAGYSDYFVHLSPPRQEEVLARTEFAEI